MPKTKVTNEHVSHEPEKTGCCGGDHPKDEKAQPVQKGQAIPSGDYKREQAHHSDTGSCGCGSGKASQ